jgi:hypothetical protein
MSITATITDRSEEGHRRYEEAARLGVDAAANVLQREVTQAHDSTYYKGGAFRGTLYVRQSIRRSDPERGPDGWSSTVGTKIIEALYWELGHHNLFTRQYERVRLWEPTALAAITRMRDAFARVVRRIMDAR